MTLFVKLTVAQLDTGPFDLYSDATGYMFAIASLVTRDTLLTGLSIPDAPDGTAIVSVRSYGVCRKTIYLDVTSTTTTTTTQPVLTSRL